MVAEIDEPFLPLPDDLVVNLHESRAVVEALLDSLPQMFANNMVVRPPSPLTLLSNPSSCTLLQNSRASVLSMLHVSMCSTMPIQ